MAEQERVLNKVFKVTGIKKYQLLLEMFSWMPTIKKLSPREKQVLAIIMFYYNKYRLLPEDERNRLIFDYETRQIIADNLGIKKQVVYNIFLSLKKKDIIGDEKIKPATMFPDLDKLIISFNE